MMKPRSTEISTVDRITDAGTDGINLLLLMCLSLLSLSLPAALSPPSTALFVWKEFFFSSHQTHGAIGFFFCYCKHPC